MELNGRGLFSTRVCDALDGGAADVSGKVTVAGVYAYVDEVSTGWEQRPLLKSNVSQITVIRQAASAVALGHNICSPSPRSTCAAYHPGQPVSRPEGLEGLRKSLHFLRAEVLLLAHRTDPTGIRGRSFENSQ